MVGGIGGSVGGRRGRRVGGGSDGGGGGTGPCVKRVKILILGSLGGFMSIVIGLRRWIPLASWSPGRLPAIPFPFPIPVLLVAPWS